MTGRFRTSCRLAWLLVSSLASVTTAEAAQSLKVPEDISVYSAPMAVIEGRGAFPFHVTFGVLVTADGAPVGLYRSYPSSNANVHLSEQYGLGMLGTKDGVILASIGQVPLLVLHGHIEANVGTYALTLTYLTRLVSRDYAECIVRVERTPQGDWETVDGAGHRITNFVVVSHRFGISHIDHCGK